MKTIVAMLSALALFGTVATASPVGPDILFDQQQVDGR